jgi:hypothetical protein
MNKFYYGRTTKKKIMLPEEWETEVDMLSVSISLTQAGAYQGLRVKRHQGREILVETNGMPPDYYYVIVGRLLDKDE